jgi:hypothetical protein
VYLNCILAVHYSCNICSAWANVLRHINLQWLWILLLCMHFASLSYTSILITYCDQLGTCPLDGHLCLHIICWAVMRGIVHYLRSFDANDWFDNVQTGLSVCDVANYRITCVLIYNSPKLCVWKLEVKMWYPFLKNFLFGSKNMWIMQVNGVIVVCFLLGNSHASEFYMPTLRNTVPSS